MANVADLLWNMLGSAEVKRCYGIVGDTLNLVIDALRRNGNIQFVHARVAPFSSFIALNLLPETDGIQLEECPAYIREWMEEGGSR
jgi:hypothetical protein